MSMCISNFSVRLRQRLPGHMAVAGLILWAGSPGASWYDVGYILSPGVSVS